MRERRGDDDRLRAFGSSVGQEPARGDSCILQEPERGAIAMKLTKAKEPTIDKAAASIAAMVDEYAQRGWNDQGRADFAKVVKRRLSRFWPR
jgi:hypothetical protein